MGLHPRDSVAWSVVTANQTIGLYGGFGDSGTDVDHLIVRVSTIIEDVLIAIIDGPSMP